MAIPNYLSIFFIPHLLPNRDPELLISFSTLFQPHNHLILQAGLEVGFWLHVTQQLMWQSWGSNLGLTDPIPDILTITLQWLSDFHTPRQWPAEYQCCGAETERVVTPILSSLALQGDNPLCRTKMLQVFWPYPVELCFCKPLWAVRCDQTNRSTSVEINCYQLRSSHPSRNAQQNSSHFRLT